MHPSKALLLVFLIVPDISTFSRLMQPLNAPTPISPTESIIRTFLRLVQSLKASLSIMLTEPEISILSRPVQFLNELPPIPVNEDGEIKRCRLMQSSKAQRSISPMVPETLTSFRLEHFSKAQYLQPVRTLPHGF